MTYYDDIYEEACDNFGLITVARAREIGVPKSEVVKLHARGKLSRVGHGVYRVKHHVPSPLDVYAEAVALVGPGSYVFGESVLAMHDLASVNPAVIEVGTDRRVRKTLPDYVRVVRRPSGDETTVYDGIPSMTVVQALRVCSSRIMPDRISEALVDSYDKGLITKAELDNFKGGWHDSE